jgi:hypothetical protein
MIVADPGSVLEQLLYAMNPKTPPKMIKWIIKPEWVRGKQNAIWALNLISIHTARKISNG